MVVYFSSPGDGLTAFRLLELARVPIYNALQQHAYECGIHHVTA